METSGTDFPIGSRDQEKKLFFIRKIIGKIFLKLKNVGITCFSLKNMNKYVVIVGVVKKKIINSDFVLREVDECKFVWPP